MSYKIENIIKAIGNVFGQNSIDAWFIEVENGIAITINSYERRNIIVYAGRETPLEDYISIGIPRKVGIEINKILKQIEP